MQSNQVKELNNPLAHSAELLRRLLAHLESDASLFEPNQLRSRIEVLDQLDLQAGSSATIAESVRAFRTRLEAANAAVYDAIRARLQRGQPEELLQWIHECAAPGDPRPGLDFDDLDELLSGVLQFRAPGAELLHPGPEMVFYQPTPARHILDLVRLAALRANDVLVDLGSGLGHVPMLVSILTGVRTIGIEIDAALVNCARECAHRLGLSHVTFVEGDAREAPLSSGTVFFLYAPFTGSILISVMHRLRSEAAHRTIRVCSLGPCTPIIAGEPWLTPAAPVDPNRVTCFRSTS
ncbi:MAG TPA: methyltransferase domain-containing protein [Terracidiphilus sp.]|nr:methyltransferase domain-containing protein [Terracidiphilus sp.]